MMTPSSLTHMPLSASPTPNSAAEAAAESITAGDSTACTAGTLAAEPSAATAADGDDWAGGAAVLLPVFAGSLCWPPLLLLLLPLACLLPERE